MTKRHTIAALGLAVALAAGCRSGGRWQVEAASWTPTLISTATSTTSLDIVETGGTLDDETFWFFDITFQPSRARTARGSTYAMYLSYLRHAYTGTNPTGFDFAGATMSGPTETTADFCLYKIMMEEPQGSQRGTERVGGLLGIHTLDFTIEATDGTNTGEFSDSSMMLVIGWRISYYGSGAVLYYASIEGADLDTMNFGDVTGSVLDYSLGMRWFVNTPPTMALSIGYRKYEADLSIRDETLQLDLDGLYYSFFMTW